MKRRIMLVDDDDAVLQALRRLFRRLPCAYGILSYELEIEMFTAPMAALARARELEFDALLSDYRMPEMDGIEFLRRARVLRPDAVLMLFSGSGDRDAVERAFAEVGIFRFIAKPWDDATLVSALAESLNYRDLMLEKRLEQREPGRK
ncbi:MAG TPA: response regulator [Rhodocyclaceae bacterium]|nr:response regulator [Rhodocyclaceae bacterium]